MYEYYIDTDDMGKPADRYFTKLGFEKARKDIREQNERICLLVEVLLKILDKKILNKTIETSKGKKKVRDILFYEIDP